MGEEERTGGAIGVDERCDGGVVVGGENTGEKLDARTGFGNGLPPGVHRVAAMVVDAAILVAATVRSGGVVRVGRRGGRR